MRAALLPTPGDPATLAYWLRNFATWRDEVDELLVLVNGQRNANTAADLARMVREAGGKCVATPDRLGHETALLGLLRGTEADRVVLCEDDAYVRRPGAVRAAFDRLDHVDVIGSPRAEDYVTQPLAWWGRYRPGHVSEFDHGLWPAFLFIRRDMLLATDCEFGARTWHPGEYIPGWGILPPDAEPIHLDTFFSTTFQLRAAGRSVELVHRVRTFQAEATERWVADDPPWFHVTGLSTLDKLHDPLDTLPDYGADGGLWTRRVAWWRRMGVDVSDFIERAGIDAAELDCWAARFASWVTWDDRAEGQAA